MIPPEKYFFSFTLLYSSPSHGVLEVHQNQVIPNLILCTTLEVLDPTIYMVIIAQLYWFTPHLLISADFDLSNPHNTEIIRLATSFLFICAFFQILEAIRLSLFAALRGLKDTRFTLITSIICFWVIALPVGYLFSILFGFGGKGFWWAMVAGAFCSVLLLYNRFKLKIRRYK